MGLEGRLLDGMDRVHGRLTRGGGKPPRASGGGRLAQMAPGKGLSLTQDLTQSRKACRAAETPRI